MFIIFILHEKATWYRQFERKDLFIFLTFSESFSSLFKEGIVGAPSMLVEEMEKDEVEDEKMGDQEVEAPPYIVASESVQQAPGAGYDLKVFTLSDLLVTAWSHFLKQYRQCGNDQSSHEPVWGIP